MNYKKFELIAGITLEGLNEENFTNILKNPEYKEFFEDKKKFLDLLDEILYRNRDQEFLKEINTVKYTIQLFQDEEIISNLFRQYREEKITREKLLETMETYRKSTDPIFVVSVFICSIIALKDVNLSSEFKKLEENIEKFETILKSLGKIENSYALRCDLVDLVYQVKTKIFAEYKYSLNINLEWVDEEIDKLNEFEFEFLNNRKELPEINVKPEQLGFIDITKLKKE